jgi:antitoxin (DNA-binding transcriptional repressor) of toxin-antitoxin stability system
MLANSSEGIQMEASMHEAKTQLSKLVESMRAGEEVILTHGRKRLPVAKIVPFGEASSAGEIRILPTFPDGKRPIGLYRGQFKLGPEFLGPLPEEDLAIWESDEADASH